MLEMFPKVNYLIITLNLFINLIIVRITHTPTHVLQDGGNDEDESKGKTKSPQIG